MSKARCRLCSNTDRLIHLFDSRLDNAKKLRTNIFLCYGLNIQSCDLDSKYVCVSCCLKAIESTKCSKTSTATSKYQKIISPDDINKNQVLKEETSKLRHSTLNKTTIVQKDNVAISYSENTAKTTLNRSEVSEDSCIPLTVVELFKTLRSKESESLESPVVLDQITIYPLIKTTAANSETTLDLMKYKLPFIDVVKIVPSNNLNVSTKTSDAHAPIQPCRSEDLVDEVTNDRVEKPIVSVNNPPNLLVPYTIKVECCYCGKSFHSESRLNMHMKGHNKCMVCKKTHASDEVLFKHLRDVCHKMVEANQPILQLERIDENISVVTKYEETFRFYSLARKDGNEIGKGEGVHRDHLNSSTDKNENGNCTGAKDVQIATFKAPTTDVCHKSKMDNKRRVKDKRKIASMKRNKTLPNRISSSYCTTHGKRYNENETTNIFPTIQNDVSQLLNSNGCQYPSQIGMNRSITMEQNHMWQLRSHSPGTNLQHGGMTQRNQIPNQTMPTSSAQNVLTYSFSEYAKEKLLRLSYITPKTQSNAIITENIIKTGNIALSQCDTGLQQTKENYEAPTLHLQLPTSDRRQPINSTQQIDLSECLIRVKAPWELNRL